jgi:hypothetical protein
MMMKNTEDRIQNPESRSRGLGITTGGRLPILNSDFSNSGFFPASDFWILGSKRLYGR